MKKYLSVFLIIFSFQGILHADSTFTPKKNKLKKPTIWQDIGNDFIIFAEDWGVYLTIPLRMNTKGLIIGSSVVAGTVLTSTVDKDFRKAVSRRNFGTYNHDFWDAPTAYGFVQYPSIFGGALYTIGLLTRENELRKTGRMLLQSLAYSGTLTMGMRILFGRHRPFTSKETQYEFSWFNMAGDTQSFPSGHTVVAFTTSTILAEQIDTWWARVVLYSFAALTGYARLYNDKHWLSDVTFGAILGYASAKFVLNREKERETAFKNKEKKKGGGFSFYPGFNSISLTYNF